MALKQSDMNYRIEEQPAPVVPMNVSFAMQRDLDPNTTTYEKWMTVLGDCLGGIGQIPCCPCFPNPFRSVEQGYVGMISRFGRFYKAVDPGLNNVNPMTEEIHFVKTMMQVINVNDMRIMTKDNVNLTIDAVIYWHIVDPFQATYSVSNIGAALMERAQTTVRAVLGQKALQDCIENRDEIANDIEEIISGPARSWGVKVESVLIKDLQFSRELQESLSSAAQAKRLGESKIISAQAEVESAKLMREAADILNSPAAIQIRYLETMQQMSKTSGSKVIFMPFDSKGLVKSDMEKLISPNLIGE